MPARRFHMEKHMEHYEREFFVSRIAAGFLKYKCRDGQILHVVAPTAKVNYESQEIYSDTFREACLEDLYTNEEAVIILNEHGIWTDKMQSDYKQIPEDIEGLKVELYNAVFKSEARKKIREYLAAATGELIRLSEIVHSWDHLTCEGVASFARWQHIILNSVNFEDGTKYDWSLDNTTSVMQYCNTYSILETEIRELSRTDPWVGMWNIFKKTGRIFSDPLTLEQKAIIMWSNMYDSISESHECPHESVIADDDMLDGWLILQKRKREKDQNKKQGDDFTKNSKIANAQEVLIPADTAEDAAKINDMNDMGAKITRASRLRQIENAEGGVKVSEFHDVKRSRYMAANKQTVKTIKGAG